MDLSSETAVEKKTKWEVGPTNGVVQAFIETLVDPMLPYEFSMNEPPSEETQRFISRQMHAVVLLYNYFHRKQKPELEFLDFVSFCKLALSLRPTLKPFLGTIHQSEAMELNGSEDHLSVAEKAIKNACDMAMSLDASKDVPTTEGYPISMVAVLLIDSEKENCLLQRDSVAKGVLSLIEKEISETVTDQETPLADNSKFLQIGFDAVKDVTGIEVSDLVVLEAHVVYSLSKEKSAAQFYMMKCNQSFDISQRWALDSLVESLEGPFAERFLEDWNTTSHIEYHRLLPYAELISSWLPRKDSSVPILSDYVAQIIKNKEAQKTAPSIAPALSPPECSVSDSDYVTNNGTERKTMSSDKVANVDGKASQKKYNHLSNGNVASPDNTDKNGHATEVSKTRRGNVDKGGDNHVKASTIGRPRRQSQRALKDDEASKRLKSTCNFFKVPVPSGVEEKTNPKVRSCQQSKNISSTLPDADGLQNDVSLKTVDLPKSDDSRYGDERYMVDKGVSVTNNQNGFIAVEENNNMVVHVEDNNEDLQNALALLDRKRQELYTRLCTMQDTLALYEHVADCVRDGGEGGLARQCIEYIVNGKDDLLLQIKDPTNPRPLKQTKFSDTYLPGMSSCQDLEYACMKNKWTLPRYFVLPSDGRFVANVVVHCMGATLGSEGSAGPTPCEARESAAAQMIAKIRDRACL